MNKSAEEIKAEKFLQDALKNKSFIQKWEQACTLRETAWNLKAARFRSQHPEWSESKVQGEVRKMFLYGST